MNTVAVSVVLYQVGLRFPNPTPSSVPAVLTPSMESLRRSLKPHHGGSHKYTCPRNELEEQSILLHNDGAEDGGEVVVKVDAKNGGLFDQPAPLPDLNRTNNSKVWREPSYEFWKEDDGDGRRGGGGGFSFKKQQRKNSEAEIADDPPSRLISTFLHKQRASGAELALDMDVEMEELKKHCSAESHLHRSSDDDGDGDERGLRRRKPSPSTSGGPDGGGGEVVQCTSNGSVHRNSTLLRAKTRSRLMDPAPPPPSGSPAAARNDEVKKSGRIPKSGQIRSGQLKSQLLDEDDEDPFMDDDIPDQFKRPDFRWLTVLQWLSLFLILAAIACSLALSPLERLTLLDLHLWKWFVLLFVLICGRLVSGWVVRLVVFGVERNFLLRKRVLYFVYGIRKAVQNCLWLGLVLISWHLLFDEKVRRETRSNFLPYVTKILFCLLVATLLRLVKTLLVKVLASSFHVSTYFDRIQESLFNQYVIETLSGPPLVEIQNVMEEEERVMAEVQKLQNAGARITNELRAAALPSKSGRVIGSGPMPKSSQIGKNAKISGAKQQDEGITIDELHKLNPKNISAWRMKKLMRIVRNGTLTTLDEQVLQECGEDDSVMQIRSEYEAKAAARNIFGNVAKPGAKYFYLVDLMRFMKEDEARKTMSMFEGANENNRVCRKSLKNWVVNAFRDRRALSLTLNDTKTAVNKLNQLANVVVGIIVFAIWLLILGIATTHFFVLLGSQLLLAAFVFGNTLKMIFEAIIFLFLMHPFDVGDRCEVEGVQMVVEEMNILTTVFLRYDNQKITYPNSVLATKPIGNFYRSPDMGESIDFCVHVATPVEKLAIMRERIIGFMANKKEHWYPNPSVVLRDVDDMNRLRISIWMRHRINFQDMGEKWARRELVVQEMIKVLREFDIEYRMLPIDVNLRTMAVVDSTRLPSTWTTFNC
ncbi:Late embryogenesis abundant protein [Musa troglodytarum]|uniref:Mechanosensitive ion channel protein n=1 Tax=Musa troglodytarum TaxID=320322 RepID=A0A9E7L7X2_9LILI|nr:Late embryogenesis abundant protein [Musa troglodytarum]